jgi:hypothetical protein
MTFYDVSDVPLVGAVAGWLLGERQPMVPEEKLLLFKWIHYSSNGSAMKVAEVLFGQLIPVSFAH